MSVALGDVVTLGSGSPKFTVGDIYKERIRFFEPKVEFAKCLYWKTVTEPADCYWVNRDGSTYTREFLSTQVIPTAALVKVV